MVVDQVLGRFAWYRRHRGGLWSRIPGCGGGYFHQPSTRDTRSAWEVALASVRDTYTPAWLEGAASKLRGDLSSIRLGRRKSA
jgi:hypothetical protein